MDKLCKQAFGDNRSARENKKQAGAVLRLCYVGTELTTGVSMEGSRATRHVTVRSR